MGVMSHIFDFLNNRIHSPVPVACLLDKLACLLDKLSTIFFKSLYLRQYSSYIYVPGAKLTEIALGFQGSLKI